MPGGDDARMDIDPERKLESQHINDLAKALEESKVMTWEVFGQRCLKLTTGQIENLKTKCPENRPQQIMYMLQYWQGGVLDQGTFGKMVSILENAELVGIKQRWLNSYKGSLEKKAFEEKLSKLDAFVNKLVDCAITEEEWTKVLIELHVRDKEDDINKANLHNKLKQRLDILHFWGVKYGYDVATIESLKIALKKARLRRVICQIAGPSGFVRQMNERFSHFLEDEWDKIFSQLNNDEKQLIFERINEDDVPADIDYAFDYVMRAGNEGFHKFIKALAQQCKEEFSSLFIDSKYRNLFNIKKVYPKVPHFKTTETYEKMKQELESKRLLELHGLPGSGKSQCASAYAKEFIKEHPMSVVWSFECKNQESIDDAISSLRGSLVEAGISTNNKSKNKMIGGIVRDLKASDLYVLLVLEDLYSKTTTNGTLENLVKELKDYKNAYVIATTRTANSAPSSLFSVMPIQGFTEKESLEFLLQRKEEIPDDEKTAAKDIAARYSYLPLGLAPARAYCNEQGLPYSYYVKAMDKEIDAMSLIKEYEEEWVREFYHKSDMNTGKNILATMVLALSTLESITIAGHTVDFHKIFSYAMYYHHEKIPVYLFKQLIMQPDILSPEEDMVIDDVLCGVAIRKLLKQLKDSSIGVVDYDKNDIYSSTVSTHRVVLFALKYMSRSGLKDQHHRKPKLINALNALSCYFQKDNRLQRQHNQLLMLTPHVTKALDMTDSETRHDQDQRQTILENMMVIRLLELKGFACTQSDTVLEAEEPLKQAHERLISLLCKVENIQPEELDRKVDERILEGNGNDTKIRTKARVLWEFCKEAVKDIKPETFNRLAQTIILNGEDIELLKRNCTGDLGNDIVENIPLTSKALKVLRDKGLALKEEKLKEIYLAEQLASILYTRGRLLFYDEFTGDKQTYVEYLKLSYYISKEVLAGTGKLLLNLLISETNGLLYLKLRENGKTKDVKLKDYEEAYGKYRDFLQSDKKYYEHGILKEDGKTSYNTMRCYRQMIQANYQALKLTESGVKEDRFNVCFQLKELVNEHQEYAKSALSSLLVAGKYCKEGGKLELAIEFFKQVMDRVKNEEEKYKKSLLEATIGFSETALKAMENGPTAASRKYCSEARQRCEKARLLVPRQEEQINKKMVELNMLLEAKANTDESDAKK